MKIYLVASCAPNWMRTGYGASLMAANNIDLLVSFVEFMKDPRQSIAVAPPEGPYTPLNVKDEGQDAGPPFAAFLQARESLE